MLRNHHLKAKNQIIVTMAGQERNKKEWETVDKSAAVSQMPSYAKQKWKVIGLSPYWNTLSQTNYCCLLLLKAAEAKLFLLSSMFDQTRL